VSATRARPGRVKDRARIEALLGWMNDRVERPAPTAAQNIDISLGLTAGRHRPDYIVGVRGIDIVVNDHDKAAQVGARMALRRDDRGLFCMAGIALLDRNDHHQAAATGDREPYAFYVRHTGFFHLVPDQG